MASASTPPPTSAGASTATLEVHHGGRWHRVGQVKAASPGRGLASNASFEYDFDYLEQLADALEARDARAVSCRYPLGYEVFDEERWPAFLLDIMPSGAARRHWERRLGVPGNDGSDWAILTNGTSHPPGNLRVASALDNDLGYTRHPGFLRSEIVERAEGFIEYAHQCGAPISGSSGAGGDSPKFLLREDVEGRWHADGALPDDRTRACWLVKFPRIPDRSSDRLTLEAEAAYHRVARQCGVRTSGEVTWERDCLFVPRFDRVVEAGKVERLGLESLCSLAGVSEYGIPIAKERLAAALARFAVDPAGELLEFVRRDVLDVALGNTDNHARNTSVLKDSRGHVALSPLYDFAPMILDERGIARVCRWADHADFPRWNLVADALASLGVDRAAVTALLRELADVAAALPGILRDCGVPSLVMRRCAERIARVEQSLREVKP